MEFQNINSCPGLEPSLIDLVENARWEDAIHLLKSVIHEPTPQILKYEAICYLKLDKATNALEVIKKAEERGWMLPDILIIKGQCLYKLQEWETALSSFEEADQIKSTPESRQWMMRCNAHISVEDDPMCPNLFVFEPPVISDVQKGWYQNNSTVCIQLFVKEVAEKDLEINFDVKSVDVLIKQKKTISIHINLLKQIIPEESTYSIHTSSVELKLKKKVPNVQWDNCEE